jgi:hypothetical protein
MKKYVSPSLLILAMLCAPSAALSTTVFDFDDVPGPARRTPAGQQVELYMEGLYGSNLTVSQKTTAVQGASILDPADSANRNLEIRKGKGATAIVIQFDDNPIDSFSIDYKLFKKSKGLSIFADGVLIDVEALTKAQKKKGLSGQKIFTFDTPVHTLEFRGKKRSFAIDNLVVDLPSGGETTGGVILTASNTNTNTDGNTNFSDDETPDTSGLPSENDNGEKDNPLPSFIATSDIVSPTDGQVAAVPEPSSLLLLLFGFAAAPLKSFLSKRRSRS